MSGIEVGPVSLEERAEAELFYATYGRAVARWADVEWSLTTMFARITGLTDKRAAVILHSASSWRGKRNILSAALSDYQSVPGHVAALRSILGVCDTYSTTRNHMAHGETRFGVTEHGHRYPMIAPMNLPWERGTSISDDILAPFNVQAATENFLALAVIIQMSYDDPRQQTASPERIEFLISQLPSPAHSKRLDPKIADFFEQLLRAHPFPL